MIKRQNFKVIAKRYVYRICYLSNELFTTACFTKIPIFLEFRQPSHFYFHFYGDTNEPLELGMAVDYKYPHI
jgi:hypothetical protein